MFHAVFRPRPSERTASAGVCRLTGLSSTLVVFRPARPGDPDVCSRLVRRLRRLYGRWLCDEECFAYRTVRGDLVVAGIGPAGARPLPGSVVVWGLPVGACGLATDDEVALVAADPARARELLGPFVVFCETPSGVRLVTSADLVHTLVRAEGGEGVAFATRGLAALVASGRPLRLAEERVPEYVVYDYVFGGDELLEGTLVLDEATVVHIVDGAERMESWWPVVDRLAPGPPTGPAALRATLGDALERLARLPGAHLLLTGGRDSTLAAACLAERGVALPALTWGVSASPDVVGARAVAAAIGAEHRLVPVEPEARPSFDRIVQSSVWTEGMGDARYSVCTPLVWGGEKGVTWVGGNGGEIGRAFYWRGLYRGTKLEADAALRILTSCGASFEGGARSAFVERMALVVERALASGRTSWQVLDVIYARERMHKWLGRFTPTPGVGGIVTAYTSPHIVRLLLDIPEEARASAAVFDAALDGGPTNLYRLAVEAVERRLGTLEANEGGRRWRRIVPRALRERLSAWRPPRPPELLARVLADPRAGETAARIMGRAWWRRALARSASDPSARRMVWNALAVDALAAWIDRWDSCT